MKIQISTDAPQILGFNITEVKTFNASVAIKLLEDSASKFVFIQDKYQKLKKGYKFFAICGEENISFIVECLQ